MKSAPKSRGDFRSSKLMLKVDDMKFLVHVFAIKPIFRGTMFKTILFGAAILAGAMAFGDTVQADTQKGRCTVVASVHGGKKFAVLKCDRASHPGDYIIRSEVWEKKDRAGYNKLARFAGRRFTCDITFDTTNRSGDTEWTKYNIDKCR